jgi:hypothetical protein
VRRIAPVLSLAFLEPFNVILHIAQDVQVLFCDSASPGQFFHDFDCVGEGFAHVAGGVLVGEKDEAEDQGCAEDKGSKKRYNVVSGDEVGLRRGMEWEGTD